MSSAAPLGRRLLRSSTERLLGSSTIAGLSDALLHGRTSSAALVEEALDAASAPDGEGPRVFARLYIDSARARARAADRYRRTASTFPALAGLPVSIKDSFDVAGEVTLAGSVVLRCCAAAETDSAVVSRLKAVGAVIVGRTNMSEFGFSGLGVSMHYGTPRNPFDREQGRIPGGSSSGAAVSVTDGMAAAAVCSDTGGSARVPAALCGLVGLKPTAGRIPCDGMLPLSPTYDSVGVLAPSVSCCGVLDDILGGRSAARPSISSLKRFVFGVPATRLLEDLDRNVAAAFERSLGVLSVAGATIVERPLPALDEIDYMGINGGLVAAEAHWWHKPLLAKRTPLYDPEVLSLIRSGAEVSGLDYVGLVRARRRGVARLNESLRHYDYLLMPTVPVIAPRLQSLEGDRIRAELTNALLLRNPSLVNFLDWCALSLPCHRRGEAPVGLTVAARGGADAMLLAVGERIESCLAGHDR
jgi:aspartyl-tRNA(Asn)/glutamyl-tRNA(Gln) amidotransferase subunit A